MESTAIVKFLADRTPLYPQPQDPRSLRRAHIDMWTDWALQFQPIVTSLAHPILGAPHQRCSQRDQQDSHRMTAFAVMDSKVRKSVVAASTPA